MCHLNGGRGTTSSGTVFDIKKFSLHDGPGIRTTVFLKGCPLKCRWCHNPESQAPEPELVLRSGRCILCGECVSACTQGAVSRVNDSIVTNRHRCVACGACAAACYSGARETIGRPMTVEEVVEEVEQDLPFYEESGGGVTFSGGEPLLQAEFLLTALRACKERGIHTAVDTSGFCEWKTLSAVAEHVDLFLYDLRIMEDSKHREFTGVSNAGIIENLTLLSRGGHHITLRVPFVPGVSEDPENLAQMAAFAAGLRHVGEVNVLAYHRMGVEKYARLQRVYELDETEPPSERRLEEAARIFREFGLCTRVGGGARGND
ncbi:MAG: glycyl-radical enzyme activating protein [Candidatus Eiseniibacteriota bacterium]|nr:MAG: glycyl-radical enzyme activating protein [Candidatus Eisenbacteria bacterium]